MKSVTVVDAHVHVHPNADVQMLLAAAALNLGAAAAKIGATTWQGILMLAEMRGADWFEEVERTRRRFGPWSIESMAPDSLSIHFVAPGMRLTIIAGRQIVTTEGIEVLALATRARIEDGSSLTATIAAASKRDALVVLPWGAGKWLGRRGRLVNDVIGVGTSGVFAGDNGGRPLFWPEGSAFRLARSKGHPVLPGTDPLPLPREELRVGSFGFVLEGDLQTDSPGSEIRERVRSARPGEIRSFGQLQGPLHFFRNQMALRFSKKVVAVPDGSTA